MVKQDEISPLKIFFPELTNEHRNVQVQLNFPLISADLSIYLHSHAWHILNTAVHFILTPLSGWNVKYYSKGFSSD